MTRLSRPLLRRFGKDESGVISVMGAMMLMLALAIAMIVVDTGALLYAKREQQAATDAAALGAVRQLDNPQAAAEAIFSLNDYATTNVQARGIYYVSDASRAPAERYFEEGETASDGTVVDANNINAVRVRQLTDSPTYFARLFGFGNMTDIETVAIATLSKHVSFSAGTRVASLNDGIANQVLGGLLGTTLNLSLIDYNALADTNIGALVFLDALAPKAGLEIGSDTYGDLLGTTVTAGDILDAAIDVLNGETANGNPSVAKLALQTALSPVSNATVPVNQLLDATPFVNRTIGSVQSAVGNDIPYNVFDLLSGSAMILGTGKAVGFNTNVNVGSLASVSGTISVGAPMVHMAVGKVGDSVRTSEVNIHLNAKISTASVPLIGAHIELPISIELASGVATIEEIPCTSGGAFVRLRGETGAASALYGTRSNPKPSVAKLSATIPLLGSLEIIDLRVKGEAQVASSPSTVINFSAQEIGQEPPVVKTIEADASLFSSLGTALQIEEIALLSSIPIIGNVGISQLANFLLVPLSTVLSQLTSSILGALSPLDSTLDALLGTLGIGVGEMDMIVHGAKCNAPTLVG
jgi:uncharacterized membrane protein